MNVDVGAVRRAKEGNIESFEMVYAQVAPDLFLLSMVKMIKSFKNKKKDI